MLTGENAYGLQRKAEAGKATQLQLKEVAEKAGGH
jgi:hypothetical protein